jgi:hypothetical protein
MGLRASLSAPVQVEWLENKNPLMVLLPRCALRAHTHSWLMYLEKSVVSTLSRGSDAEITYRRHEREKVEGPQTEQILFVPIK